MINAAARVQRARALRKNLTPQETILWARLRLLREQGYHFRRQAPFAGYFLDFACFKAKLAIEVDGSQHYQGPQAARDVVRDASLRKAGFQILRVGNGEINTNIEGVMDSILEALGAR